MKGAKLSTLKAICFKFCNIYERSVVKAFFKTGHIQNIQTEYVQVLCVSTDSTHPASERI